MRNSDSNFNIPDISKIIETPNHFVLSAHMYKKDTMQPEQYKFYRPDSTESYSFLKNSLTKTTNIYGENCFAVENTMYEKNIDNYFIDKTNKNIHYAFRYANYDGMKIVKIQYDETEKTYMHLIERHLYTLVDHNVHTTFKGRIQLLYEEDDHFVINIQTLRSGRNGHDYVYTYTVTDKWGTSRYYNYYNRILKIYKKDLSFEVLFHDTDAYYTFLLKRTNEYLYILTETAYNIKIYRVNIFNLESVLLFTYGFTVSRLTLSNPINIDDYYYCLIPMADVNGRIVYKYFKFYISPEDEIAYEIVDIVNDNYKFSEVNLDYHAHLQGTQRIIKTKDNIYITVLLGRTPNGLFTVKSYKEYSKLCTLKFNEDGNFEVTNVIKFVNGCAGCLLYNDEKHLLIYEEDKLSYYVFDNVNETFKNVWIKNGDFDLIGLDEYNKLYLMYANKNIEMLENQTPILLNVQFDKEVYKETEEITASYYAKDFLDNYIEKDVNLKLIGNAMFLQNRKTSITVTTGLGIKTIPVKITGKGKVEIFISPLP